MKIFDPSLWTTADLLTHLWQSTVVAVVVLILLMFCERVSAKIRHGLAWIALLKFAFPIALLASLPRVDAGAGERGSSVSQRAFSTEWSIAVVSIPPVEGSWADFSGPIAVALWLAGAGGFFGIWLARAEHFRRRIVAEAVPVSGTMRRKVEEAAATFGMRTPPRCLVGPSDIGPGVVGIFSPILILPAGLAEALNSAEFEAILLHEFVHIDRRDNLRCAARALLGSLFWFHPLVALLNRRIGAESEKVCDQRVLELTGDPEAYANGIVKSLRNALGLVQPGCAGIATPPVAARLKAILAHPPYRERPLVRRLVLAAGVGLLMLSGSAGSFVTAASMARTGRPAGALPLATAAATTRPSPAETSERTVAEGPPTPTRSAGKILSDQPPSVTAPQERPLAPPASIEIVPALASLGELSSLSTALGIVAKVKPQDVNEAGLGSAGGNSGNAQSGGLNPPENRDHRPVVISQTPPVYPLFLRRTKQTGTVLVDFVVEAQGNVTSAHAQRSSDRRFEQAAVDAVRKWKFQPGMKDGHPVDMPARVSVVFAFHDE